MTAGPRISVLRFETDDVHCERLAALLGVPLVNEPPLDGVVVAAGPHGLELRSRDDKPGQGARLESAWLRHALAGGGATALRSDPLARALAARGDESLHVVDATAGLGGDTLLLAALGHRVTAFERSPALWAVLDDGLRRLSDDALLGPIVKRIELRRGDAIGLLATLDSPADVVYADPMFPARRRASALPPKSAQRLRAAVGDDGDGAELLRAARGAARRRVVIKRTDDAPWLGDEKPPFAIAGKTVRYDVYVAT